MGKIIPSFEVNGKRYEIKRNRYLTAELDKWNNEIKMTDEEESESVKEQAKLDNLEKLAKRKEELYEKFLETFSKEDEEIYNKSCVAYEKLVDELAKSKNVVGKQRKKMLDCAEKLIIRALQLDEKGNEIRSDEETKEIWCTFVEEVGKTVAVEFVVYTANYILGGDEEENENPFLKAQRTKMEKKLEQRRGLSKVQK